MDCSGLNSSVSLRFLSRLCLLSLAACASANAADLPVDKDPPVSTSSGVNWNGLYFGAQWGYATGTTKWRDPRGYYSSASDVPANGYDDGLAGGVRIGYGRQFGATVVGIDADLNRGSLVGYAPCGATTGVGGSGDTCGNRTEWMASLTGRIGHAAGRSLFYLKFGGAYTRDQTSVANYHITPIPPVSNSLGRYGWTIGGGVEYAIAPKWSVYAEYGFYDFGRQTHASGTGVHAGSFSLAHTQQVAKFGINYRMDAARGNVASLAIGNGLTGEFGTRAGYSSGRYRKKLYDTGQLSSILTWHGQAGLAVEAFARLDHSSGLFLKGTLGGVNIGPSHMNDEDTAETLAPDPYSNTLSPTRDGRTFYGTADLGYTFLWNQRGDLGAFAGYGRYTQRMNAYGCTQVASGIYCVPGIVNPSALTLSETEMWNALRIGLTGSAMLTERLNFSGEAVWLAYASLSGKDNHWLRPDINPLLEDGHGSKGYQLESTLSYALTKRWNIGAGVRYLLLRAEGGVQFPIPDVPRSQLTFKSSRFTAFLQASYRFGHVTAGAPAKH